MRTTDPAVRANLRAWWPELIWVAVMAVVCFTAADGAVGFVVVLLFTGAFWLMGYRHRHRPLWEVIRRMDGKLDRALAAPARRSEPPAGDPGPQAEARHLHSV
jgi:hypothetical protein